jgi:hypothetical protein
VSGVIHARSCHRASRASCHTLACRVVEEIGRTEDRFRELSSSGDALRMFLLSVGIDCTDMQLGPSAPARTAVSATAFSYGTVYRQTECKKRTSTLKDRYYSSTPVSFPSLVSMPIQQLHNVEELVNN